MRRLSEDPDQVRERRAWAPILLLVAFGVYLSFRIVQMVGWALEAMF